MNNSSLDQLSINTIRFLSADMVQKAVSGHPGAPMGAAVMAYVLWQKYLKHNPSDPEWCDRDRFILSAGHASALLYSLLHLTGYDLSMDEIKQFRQWDSKTPGHPEHGLTPGVEATTGPLGQGFANGIGMAIAESWLAAQFNKPDGAIVDHRTYAICSDGDLMEGVSAEAASLAGTLKLGKIIYLYDDNNITIEGNTSNYFSEDVGARFRAYGWHVIGPINGMEINEVEAALAEAHAEIEKPKLIICRTVIGYGAPTKANSGAAHGEALGEAELAAAKKNLGWPYTESFFIPEEVRRNMSAVDAGKSRQAQWQSSFDAYRAVYPEEAAKFKSFIDGKLPEGWNEGIEAMFKSTDKPLATREASGKVMNVIGKKVENLIGGSGDLAPSTKTVLDFDTLFGAENRSGRNLQFGVREHAMGAISNGIALHGGIIPYAATFLAFYDYMRPSVRLAALQELRVIFIYTHDSIGLGEDGPTHQPVEQALGLRSVPNLVTLRPADAAETAVSWEMAIERHNGPTALVLTRQKLPPIDRSGMSNASLTRRGGYILWQADAKPTVIIIGTGSEVHPALEAGKKLKEMGISSRVVSLPSWEVFEAQSEEYKLEVLPPQTWRRVTIEAGRSIGWERYAGCRGVIIGLDHYGASAPGNVVMEQMGFTAADVVEAALKLSGQSDA
ncbi:transketolase [Dehalogenimonas etheniformans]|uniref:Transketolase n=1 Tax=Dehalogenimonas etheniformans TaxID=1536648 RepID=A0A2P5P9R5_9CHLR|nr:transketolase [Dehalogenimonas etheniformans]PPD59014.1 transketolase [Dehalogenimonas etheniformans]QNT76219.1 transketolase [Dehalogenimonas etheniformans]